MKRDRVIDNNRQFRIPIMSWDCCLPMLATSLQQHLHPSASDLPRWKNSCALHMSYFIQCSTRAHMQRGKSYRWNEFSVNHWLILPVPDIQSAVFSSVNKHLGYLKTISYQIPCINLIPKFPSGESSLPSIFLPQLIHMYMFVLYGFVNAKTHYWFMICRKERSSEITRKRKRAENKREKIYSTCFPFRSFVLFSFPAVIRWLIFIY